MVRLAVAKFTELGAVQGVVRFLAEHGIQLGVRARSGPDNDEIVWKRPARATITGMINSPIDAGIDAYGRRPSDHTGVRGGRDPGGDQEAIRQAAADLPRLWEAPGVTHADRKDVVRAVVDEVTVSIRGVSELVDVGLHWAGGGTTTGLVRRPIQYFEHLSYYPRLQQRVLALAEAGWHPGKIADRLDRDGYQSARADGPIRYRVVEQILRRNGRALSHQRDPLPIDPAEAPGDNEWLLPRLAAHLGCTTGTLRGWLRDGQLTGRQETRAPHRWILRAPPEKIDELRHRPARARGRTARVHPHFAEALKGDIP